MIYGLVQPGSVTNRAGEKHDVMMLTTDNKNS